MIAASQDIDREIILRIAPGALGAGVSPALARILTTDGLTGLHNRPYFDERLRLELATATPERPLALLLVDLDQFKQLNDRYGHPVGDQALRSAALALTTAAPERAVACRLGGDEFVVLVPQVTPKEAAWLPAELAQPSGAGGGGAHAPAPGRTHRVSSKEDLAEATSTAQSHHAL